VKTKIKLFWESFISIKPYYKNKKIQKSFYFYNNERDANDCSELVIKKEKQATAHHFGLLK